MSKKQPPSREGFAACIRYIEAGGPGQFDYVNAKAKGLLIDSGKLESTHHSLIQRRLKIPEAWWL